MNPSSRVAKTVFWCAAVLFFAAFAAGYLYTTGLWEFLILHTEPAKHSGLTEEQIIGYLGPQFWHTTGVMVGLLLGLLALVGLGTRAYPGERKTGAPQRFAWIAGGVALAALIVGFGFSWHFELDDKWITYRTSLNILKTGLPVWNVGEKVNLCTSFVWPYVCVIGHWLGDWNDTVKIIGFLFALGTSWLAWKAVADPFYRLVAAAGVILFYPFVLWSIGGLETAMATFYLVLCVWIFLRSEGRSLVALALMGAVMFVRPDLVLVGAGAAGWLVLFSSETIDRKARGAFAYALPIAGFLVFHYAIFGVPFPRPYYIKGLNKASSPHYGLVNDFLSGVIPMNSGLVIYLLLLGVAMLVLVRLVRARQLPAWPFLGVAAGLAAHVIYTDVCGYQHMAFTFRYYIPSFVAGLVMLLMLLDRLQAGRALARFEYGFLAGLVCLQAVIFGFTARQAQKHTLALTRAIMRDNFSIESYGGWMKIWIESGEYLKSVAKPDETLYTMANMVAPSVSNVYAIDQFYMPTNLSSHPDIAHPRPQFDDFTYVLVSPEPDKELAEDYPYHYLLKRYQNLLILKHKPAPSALAAGKP